MTDEIVEYKVRFKDIEGYIGMYQITSDGRVYSKKSDKFLAPYPDSGGYLYVNLNKNSVGTKCKIHKLVANAFLKNPDSKNCVDHINGCRTDNNLSNLRFATRSENGANRNCKKNKKLQVKGVYEREYGFQAMIRKDDKVFTKRFKTVDEAVIWRRERELELFGEFSHNS